MINDAKRRKMNKPLSKQKNSLFTMQIRVAS